MLADPACSALIQAIGRASLGADDAMIWHLTKASQARSSPYIQFIAALPGGACASMHRISALLHVGCQPVPIACSFKAIYLQAVYLPMSHVYRYIIGTYVYLGIHMAYGLWAMSSDCFLG